MNKYTIVPWVFLATFTPLGMLCIHLAIQQRVLGKQSLSWPVAAGVVESAEVDSSSDDGSTSYSPKIAYHYYVASNKYLSKRIRFAAIGGGDYQETKAVVDRYVPGKQASVYYNPSNPSDSVLEPGTFGMTLYKVPCTSKT
jgi:hypothetical protein